LRRIRWSGARSVASVPRVLAIAVVVLLSGTADANNQYVILGAGSRPCGSWLQVRSQTLPDSAMLQSWVLGYITSVNANVLATNEDVAGGAGPDALFSWIDNYCAAHPFDSVARASSALLESLRSKRSVK
jgi:hypothetical protein